MRKTLLMSVMLTGTTLVMAQQTVVQPSKDVANKPHSYKRYSRAIEAFGTQAMNKDGAKSLRTTTEMVGNSTYSLQTNSSIGTRISNNSDGTRSLVWTWSALGGSFTDRGTGYVYFNGTSHSAPPTARIESLRTGWPSIGVLGDNSEVLISHSTAPYGTQFLKRPVKGVGAWTQNGTALTSSSTYANIWSRMAIGGSNNQTIHVISLTNPVDPTVATNPPPIYYEGQQGALLYYRSQDGGATWDIQNYVNPLHDSADYVGFDGDSYAIDASGNTVAYVCGTFTTDLFLMKSIDNGNTWTKTVLMTFPISMCSDCITDVNGDNTADTINTTDGSVAVLIDNNGVCHVWAGAMRVLDDDSTDNVISYFPGTNGLLYWNENMGASAPVTITGAIDYNGNGQLDIPSPGGSTFGFGVYQVSLSGQPHAAIDATGKIYLSYASLIEGTDINSKAVRNICAMMTADGGSNWSDVSRISPDDYSEQVFASVARKADGCVHFIYQQDAYPGHGIGTNNQDASDNSGVVNEIYYACVDTAAIANGNVGIQPVNVEMINEILVYPNPAQDMITIEIGSLRSDLTSIRLVNVTGQEVMSEKVMLIEGNNFLKLSLNGLAKGVYMLNATMEGGSSKTQRVVVK